jgi:uncharacterized membrane protein YheB (UPF0754 family)
VRRPIWGQGLIPANKNRIAEKLAGTINQNILNETELKKRLTDAGVPSRIREIVLGGTGNLVRDPDFQQKIKDILNRFLEEYFQNAHNRKNLVDELDKKIHEIAPGGVGALALNTYLRLNRQGYRRSLDKAVVGIPQTIAQMLDKENKWPEEIAEKLESQSERVEELIAKSLMKMIDSINIYELVLGQIQRFDEGKLEDMLWNATSEQLLYIEYLGALLGIFGGLVLWQPFFMGGLLLTTLGIAALLDRWLFSRKRLTLPPP